MKRLLLCVLLSCAGTLSRAGAKQSEKIDVVSPADGSAVTCPVRVEWRCAPGLTNACAIEVMERRTGAVVYAGEGLLTNAVELADLVPGGTYTWCVWCGKEMRGGTFTAGSPAPRRTGKPGDARGLPKWYEPDGIRNMRDLGGWTGLDGRKVKVGRVFRAEKLDRISDAGRAFIVGTLGVKTDLDLRTPKQVAHLQGKSPLGVSFVNRSSASYGAFDSDKGRRMFAETFRWFLNEAEYPVLFHCAKGADRTGTWAFLLNGLLGVAEADLRYDWEVTSDYNPNPLFKHRGRYSGLVGFIEKRPGATFTDKVVAYAHDCGITDEEIANWRGMMLEATAEPVLRVGILSDTHLKLTDDSAELGGILEGLKRRGADVIAISGDVVEDGKVAEYARFADIWKGVFGAMPGRAGAPHLFLAWGNHDYRAATKFRGRRMSAAEESEFMLGRKDEVWRMLFDEPFPGEVYAKTFCGVTFVGAHWGHERETGPWLAAHPETVRPDGFFIYVQHLHPSGTVFGAVTGAAAVTRDLSAYPRCFAISGHSHMNLADDMALWQGAFTSMAAGTTRGAAVRHGDGVPVYANGRFKRNPKAEPPYPHMATCKAGRSHQGSVLSIYPDRLVIERIDFRSGKPLGDDWILPRPLETHPEAPWRMGAGGTGPEFPAGAVLSAEMRDGVNVMGEPERQLVLRAPQARPTSRYGRAIVNRFEVLDAETDELLLAADALQPGQALPIEDGLKLPAECAFAAADIPAGRKLKLRLTAKTATGVPGRPIERICD